ncbi:MAG: hypothetical protein A3A27_00935 [Candidatus Wildermuthbacteria bacterium RIFCSPLOWO2_01_FULL_47_18]|uniref:Transposase IS200-like domain-containing protein n=1 Tax=Candidatus Wildermuthbacteria bacterium RIFCSPLOWO2_01_FULL_47_18 TaxID=1802460 RepID=A0A1G2RIM8_9BACT|nr:MAG: hypothetical protein A3A27_00935 [Candidatus Wildermuthbacteria bacterium RIFCSPLOWO2_01_FULL_47_18]
MEAFNTVEPVGSLYLLSFEDMRVKKSRKLVDVLAYCLNPNHFHIILKQRVKNGISMFIKRLAGGHAYYFNVKHKRIGTLFQGPFKAKHVPDNDYLLHLSAYVNLNNRVHQLRDQVSQLVRSSWKQYSEGAQGLCTPGTILKQFKSVQDYRKFALSTLPGMVGKREDYRELKSLLLENR